jgi:hypothetical protein
VGALLARADGGVLVEAQGVWQDAGRGYVARVRTAWLGPAQDGFQRVRRFSLLGDLVGAGVVLTFRDFHEDRWIWTPDADDTVASGDWGDGLWGDGAWGDPDNDGTDTTTRRDRVLRARRGLARQKCQRVSVEWRDNAPPNEGARFSSVAIEFGRREGLKRGPHRTFT